MRILIAEDDELARMILEMILQGAGHQVVVTSDGLEALEAFRRTPFPVVLSDWNMPTLNGLALLKEIRKIQGNEKPIFVMITAETREAKRQEAIKAGVDDFITKPVNVEDFKTWDKRFLEQRVRQLAAAKKVAPATTAKPSPIPIPSATPQSSASAPSTPAVARHRTNPRPAYPQEARQNRQEGLVRLGVRVGADGMVKDVALRETSGFPLLDEAAVAAVRRWVYDPATTGGVPVATYTEIPIRFNLTQA